MHKIIVSCSKENEWMLPWWWMHYHYHNSLPVAFLDLGISLQAKRWCAKRGVVVDQPLSCEGALQIDLNAQVCGPLSRGVKIIPWTEENIRGAIAICEKLLMNLSFEE